MDWSLGELAERLGGEVVGDRARRVEGIRTLDAAGPRHLSFLTSARYAGAARASAAGALLVGHRLPETAAPQIVVADPAAALATLLEWLHPEPVVAPGVHATAVVGAGCAIDASAAIGAYAVLGRDVTVGAGAVLHPHVVLYRRTAVGDRAVVHAGTVLGADGFGYTEAAAGGLRKIPQVGDVAIGEDVEIGALSAVDRALLGTTRVGAGTKIDNLVQVGHNVEIGRGAILCGQAGVAGSAKLGDGVVVAGQSGVAGHLTMGDRSRVASKSAVYGDVRAGETVAGVPAVPIGDWRRRQALLARLADLWRRLRRLEGRGAAKTDGEGES